MSDELREAIAQHDEGIAGTHQYDEIVPIARQWLNDPISLIRRGVESGTIKGSETTCNVCQGDGRHVDGRTGDLVSCDRCEGLGRTLVIPVSEGSEDR